MRGAVNLALLIIVVNVALAWVIAKDPLLGYMIATAAGIALVVVGIALLCRIAYRRACRIALLCRIAYRRARRITWRV